MPQTQTDATATMKKPARRCQRGAGVSGPRTKGACGRLDVHQVNPRRYFFLLLLLLFFDAPESSFVQSSRHKNPAALGAGPETSPASTCRASSRCSIRLSFGGFAFLSTLYSAPLQGRSSALYRLTPCRNRSRRTDARKKTSQAASLGAAATSKPTRGKCTFTLPTEGSSCRMTISSAVQARIAPCTGLP